MKSILSFLFVVGIFMLGNMLTAPTPKAYLLNGETKYVRSIDGNVITDLNSKEAKKILSDEHLVSIPIDDSDPNLKYVYAKEKKTKRRSDL